MRYETQRVILHSDMNCFYASVEMMHHPELQGTAMAVCGATETRHGIILAKSQRAKEAGVTTGMVSWEAKQRCPGLILVPPHYEQYIKYSKMARAIYERFTDYVEPFGMDECWLDVTGSRTLFGDGPEMAERIRCTIKKELGLTVSIGVARNKVFAKLGSDMKKPDAVTVIADDFKPQIWPLPMADLLYCGPRTTEKLRRYGIRTIGQFAALPESLVKQWLGKRGQELWRYANGQDWHPVQRKDFVSPIKSIGHGITCVADLETEEEVWKVILELCQDIGHKLLVHHLRAGGVGLYLRDNELKSTQAQQRFRYRTIDPWELARRAMELCYGLLHGSIRVRAVSVRAMYLSSAVIPEQLDLFDDTDTRFRRERLFETVDDLRRRYGKHCLVSADVLGDIKLPAYRDHALLLPGTIGR